MGSITNQSLFSSERWGDDDEETPAAQEINVVAAVAAVLRGLDLHIKNKERCRWPVCMDYWQATGRFVAHLFC